jgi:hypothetical protein
VQDGRTARRNRPDDQDRGLGSRASRRRYRRLADHHGAGRDPPSRPLSHSCGTTRVCSCTASPVPLRCSLVATRAAHDDQWARCPAFLVLPPTPKPRTTRLTRRRELVEGDLPDGLVPQSGGRYRPELLKIFEPDFARKGLPADHGIHLLVSRSGQSWYAWRNTQRPACSPGLRASAGGSQAP